MSTHSDVFPAQHMEAIEAQSRLQDLAWITKPRLSSLVLMATMCGFFFGAPAQFNLLLMVETILGTMLVAAGASALNQVIERHTDRLMARTRNRPLPAGRMDAGQVLNFGVACGVAGLLYLALRVNIEASLWAALTLALYVFVYTPLKRVSTLNTLVGAIPGAMPPLIGWAAAQGGLDARAWALFAILFLWQIPHFLAIAWIYRADYANAGLKMLPAVESDGCSTARQVVVHSVSLLPVSLLPLFMGMAGVIYFAAAVVLGLGYIAFALNFSLRRNDRSARQLFLASVVYLPLLLAVMMFDRV